MNGMNKGAWITKKKVLQDTETYICYDERRWRQNCCQADMSQQQHFLIVSHVVIRKIYPDSRKVNEPDELETHTD